MAGESEVIFSHTNSELEDITVERVTSGEFKGQLLLVIHDDPPFRTKAPMMLDKSTLAWLRRVVNKLESEE